MDTLQKAEKRSTQTISQYCEKNNTALAWAPVIRVMFYQPMDQ